MADHEKVYSIKFDVTKSLAALGKFNKRLEKTEVLVKRIRKAAGPMFRSMSRGYKKLGKSIDQVDRKTKKLGKSAINTSKQIQKAAKKSKRAFDGIGKRASALGSTMTRRVTLPLAIAGVASLKFARDFNRGLANVHTLLDGGIDRIEGLKKGVMALSADVGKPLGDLTDGLYQVISALGDTDESMGQLEVAARGAVAGVASTEESISLLSGVMNAYNETSVKQMETTSDLAFMAVKLGVTTYPKLAASMGRVTPLAAAMGTSQAELFATMATGTKVGTETAEVATQIASVYSAMLKPTDALKKTVKKLGFESANAMMKEKGFRGTLIALNEAVDGNEEKMAAMLKRKEAMLIATVLLGGQSENYTEILGKMEKATGSTDEAYRRQTEGINKQGHEWEKTKQKMVGFGVRIGDKLLPVLGKLFTAIEPILEKLEKMDPATLEWGLKIAGFLAILGPGLKVFGGLATVVETIVRSSRGLLNFFSKNTAAAGKLSSKVGTLGGKLNSLAGSIGAIAVAAAVGAAIGTVVSETIVKPEMEKKAKREDVEENVVRRAKEAVKHGSAAEKEAAKVALLQHYGKKKEQGQRAFQIADPMEMLASKIMGVESPAEKQKRLLKEGAFAVKQLSHQQRQGAGMTNNITVNAPGGDPKVIAKEVEKSMGKALRRGAQGIGAGEQ